MSYLKTLFPFSVSIPLNRKEQQQQQLTYQQSSDWQSSVPFITSQTAWRFGISPTSMVLLTPSQQACEVGQPERRWLVQDCSVAERRLEPCPSHIRYSTTPHRLIYTWQPLLLALREGCSNILLNGRGRINDCEWNLKEIVTSVTCWLSLLMSIFAIYFPRDLTFSRRIPAAELMNKIWP